MSSSWFPQALRDVADHLDAHPVGYSTNAWPYWVRGEPRGLTVADAVRAVVPEAALTPLDAGVSGTGWMRDVVLAEIGPIEYGLVHETVVADIRAAADDLEELLR